MLYDNKYSEKDVVYHTKGILFETKRINLEDVEVSLTSPCNLLAYLCRNNFIN